MNEKEIAKIIIPKLQNLGFIVHRYDAYSTNSIYLKLDYGVACGIRISDHNGKKQYHYRFNLIKNYTGNKVITNGNLVSYFYNFDEIDNLLIDAQKEKIYKIKKYGLEKYQEILNKESSNELFIRFKKIA